VTARGLAGMSGVLAGALLVVWSLGGHVTTFRWWLGAEGERETAKEIEKLEANWHCEHDLEHERGNWDHVLVGPPGVFLLDSKSLSGTVAMPCARAGRITRARSSELARSESTSHSRNVSVVAPRGFRPSSWSGASSHRLTTKNMTSSTFVVMNYERGSRRSLNGSTHRSARPS
jgi:hypothetical protein